MRRMEERVSVRYVGLRLFDYVSSNSTNRIERRNCLPFANQQQRSSPKCDVPLSGNRILGLQQAKRDICILSPSTQLCGLY